MYILNIKEAMHGLFSYAVESIHAVFYYHDFFCELTLLEFIVQQYLSV